MVADSYCVIQPVKNKNKKLERSSRETDSHNNQNSRISFYSEYQNPNPLPFTAQAKKANAFMQNMMVMYL